ncbi:hypothetical protein JCM5353_008172 [Sporobolomyces roseus]
MATEVSNDSKIDRFSSLPNEIIQFILDEVYSGVFYVSRRLLAPSKRFQPFYHSKLYRSIKIRSQESIVTLLQTLQNRPEAGLITDSLVFEFNFLTKENEFVSIANSEQLRCLLCLLPNLVTLKLDVQPDSVTRQLLTSSTCMALTRVSLPITPSRSSTADLTILPYLSKIPNLHTLELSDWDDEEDNDEDGSPDLDCSFPSLERLSIIGDDISTLSVVALINSCPKLARLRLVTSSMMLPPAYEDLLPSIEPPLELLDLTAFSFVVLEPTTFAKHSHLHSLRLATNVFPFSLNECLAGLAQLEHLCIMSMVDSVPAQELLNLVDGSTRLGALRKITLDVTGGSTGLRVNPFTVDGLSAIKSKEYEGWLDDENGEWFTTLVTRIPPEEWLLFKKVLKVAGENGIIVEGDCFDGLKTLHAYLLELNNLSIVRAYYHLNFHTIPHARQVALDHRFPLPELDIDSIDTKKLELVRVEMEEHGWFALTLRNKEPELRMESLTLEEDPQVGTCESV